MPSTGSGPSAFGVNARRRGAPVTCRFEAYNIQIGLRTAESHIVKLIASRQFETLLPPGWRREDGQESCEAVAVWYDVSVASSPHAHYQYTLHAGAELVAIDDHLTTVLRAFTTHAEFVIARHAPEHLFVHAGVVSWHDCAVLIPGRSLSGKTTLVRAFLEAGATYFSDEFAVLDRAGDVHPYPRPLAVRHEPGQPVQRVTAESLGAQTGVNALRVGLVLVTTYRLGALWRPRRLTPARTLLALLTNTVAAQGSPAHSMPILRRAVALASGFDGARGEAAALVKALGRRPIL